MTRCTLRHLAKRFGRLAALRDASLDVRAGEVLGLLGPNGAGKTTLMACMAGLLPPDQGHVQFGEQQHELDARDRRAQCFYLPDGLTPWSAQPANWLLDFADGVFGTRPLMREDVLEVLRIAELGTQLIGTLSKGQRKRLLLALALLRPHDILLLDEPFDGLDLRLTREVIALLQRQAVAGRSLVVSLHAMHDASRVCDRVVLLDDGRTVAEGTVDELRDRAGMPDAPLDEVFLALV